MSSKKACKTECCNSMSNSSSNRSRPSIRAQRGSGSSVTTTSGGLLSVDFEVRGKVQGVHFRKHTQKKATELNLRGWCRNTDTGTVLGCLEGERLQIDMMKDWLKRTGSPKSRIDGANFKPAKSIPAYTRSDFQIVK